MLLSEKIKSLYTGMMATINTNSNKKDPSIMPLIKML
jgi:hypothetical protein